jgi:hypothetical protein
MRRIDKKLNLTKANLLAEQRYINSKTIINENFDEITDEMRNYAKMMYGEIKTILTKNTNKLEDIDFVNVILFLEAMGYTSEDAKGFIKRGQHNAEMDDDSSDVKYHIMSEISDKINPWLGNTPIKELIPVFKKYGELKARNNDTNLLNPAGIE